MQKLSARGSSSGGNMIKRIWAIVSEKDFYAFQARARNEGLDMGEGLAAVVHAFATDAPIKLKAHKDHVQKLREGVDYVRVLRLSEGDKTLTGGK